MLLCCKTGARKGLVQAIGTEGIFVICMALYKDASAGTGQAAEGRFAC